MLSFTSKAWELYEGGETTSKHMLWQALGFILDCGHISETHTLSKWGRFGHLIKSVGPLPAKCRTLQSPHWGKKPSFHWGKHHFQVKQEKHSLNFMGANTRPSPHSQVGNSCLRFLHSSGIPDHDRVTRLIPRPLLDTETEGQRLAQCQETPKACSSSPALLLKFNASSWETNHGESSWSATVQDCPWQNPPFLPTFF